MGRANLHLSNAALICGAGPIGPATLTYAHADGVDLETGRLPFAESLFFLLRDSSSLGEPRAGPRVCEGYYVAREEAREALAARIMHTMGGTEPDVALECTNARSSIGAAIEAVMFGGTVFVVGVGKREMTFPFMRMREVDVRFQYRYANAWPRTTRLLETGVLSDVRRYN